jgi:hypothetical protein
MGSADAVRHNSNNDPPVPAAILAAEGFLDCAVIRLKPDGTVAVNDNDIRPRLRIRWRDSVMPSDPEYEIGKALILRRAEWPELLGARVEPTGRGWIINKRYFLPRDPAERPKALNGGTWLTDDDLFCLLAKCDREHLYIRADELLKLGFNLRQKAETGPPPPIVLTLPEQARYGLLGEIVAAWEPETEAHPAALLASFLVMFGNAAGRGPRGPHMLHAGAEHRLNLNMLVVGATARSRKGTSRALAESTFRNVDATWLEDCNVSGFGSGEALIEAVRDPRRTGKKDKEGNDIIEPGVTDKRLLITEGEFTRIIAVMQRDGSTLSAILRDAWDGRPLQIKTRVNPAKATGAHISVLAHITAEELQRHIDRTELVNGFLNRFILVHVHRTKLLPMGGNPPPNLASLTGKLREALFTATNYTGRMHFSPAAEQMWVAEYANLERERPGLINFLTTRAAPQVLRLAMIYAAVDGSRAIEPAHLTAALAFWSYCEASEGLIFGYATGDPTADTIAEALQAAGREGLSRTDIYRGLFGCNKTADEISRALRLLERAGHIERYDQPGKGRTAERWRWIG